VCVSAPSQNREHSIALNAAEVPYPESECAGANTAGVHHCGPSPLYAFGSECSESSRWNRFERPYIRLFGIVDLPTRIRARLVIQALRKIPWETMIDFGSGRGAYSFYFSRFGGARVWGVDIDNNFVSDCRAVNRKLRRKSLEFVCSRSIFETNRFMPDSIDVVLAVESIQYVPDIQEGFREIQRVLKPGGHLIAHVPVGYSRTPGKALFDSKGILNFTKEAGLEPVAITRVFGRTAKLLTLIFSQCMRCRLLLAFMYPALLLASLACKGESSDGDYCMIVARKQ
jgi:SAM-dependent methyltransferase